jgi:hypothetical protein
MFHGQIISWKQERQMPAIVCIVYNPPYVTNKLPQKQSFCSAPIIHFVIREAFLINRDHSASPPCCNSKAREIEPRSAFVRARQPGSARSDQITIFKATILQSYAFLAYVSPTLHGRGCQMVECKYRVCHK